MVELTLKDLQATNEVIKRLNVLRRWTSFVTEDKYNELAKQALNCITCYLLASYAEEAGEAIKWERFPRIALYRAYQKVYVYFDTPEHIIDEICSVGKINKASFNDATKEIIAEVATENFAENLNEVLGTYEIDIFRAATKIATLVELMENKSTIHESEEYSTKMLEVQKSLLKYENIPGVRDLSDPNGDMFKLLMKISKLRNQNRWAVSPYTIECSVLGHLFDTACFAYFIGLENYDKQIATKMFFIGIFHDLAEVWTTDVPSPIKDRIPGFRKATEEYELLMLEKNLYSKVPNFLAKKIKEVMMEDEQNQSLKKIMKTADYLSADSECWRQYVGGSRDPYFAGAIDRNHQKLEKGELPIPEMAYEFHNYLVKEVKKLSPN